MRIERLDSNKIKVTLTTADLSNLDIDVQQLSMNSKELHTFLFHIMETIREETGFNPYNGQVVVEATPSNEGISILVSRMDAVRRKITRAEFNRSTSVKAKLKQETDSEIFYFNSFNDMCYALGEIDSEGLRSGSLYKLNDSYCVIIGGECEKNRCLNILSEFAVRRSDSAMQREYIREHGKLIAENKNLVDMAMKMRQIT